MLEHELNLISVGETSEGIDDLMASQDQALYFLQEIGWLLQRSHVRAMSDQVQYCTEGFPVERFRWLLSFAVDREWCAVVNKLLNIMFQGNIDLDVSSPVECAQGLSLLANCPANLHRRSTAHTLKITHRTEKKKRSQFSGENS
jgi:hypothetical protein